MNMIFTQLSTQLWIICFFYIAVIIFTVLDMLNGIKKAKLNNISCDPHELKKTIIKIVNYFNFLLILNIIDFLIMFLLMQEIIRIPVFPYLSCLATIIIGFVEFKTIYKSTDVKDKEKINDTINLLISLIKNKDDILKVSNIINNNLNKNEDNNLEVLNENNSLNNNLNKNENRN